MQNTAVMPQGAQAEFNTLVPDEYRLALLEYWRIVMRRKWAILSFGLVIGVLALAIAMSMTPVYRSSVILMMEEGKTSVVKIEDVIAVTKNREYFNTQTEIIKSREVGLRTVRKLELWKNPEFDPRIQQKKKAGLRDIFLGKMGFLEDLGIISPQKKEWTEDELVQAAYGRLLGKLTVTPGRLSLLVTISFDSTDPEISANVVNAIANQYIFADRDGKVNSSQEANSWLQERLQGLRDNLMVSERKLQGYRERSGIVEMGGSVQQFAGQQISEVSKNLIDAKVRRAEFESAYVQLKSVKDGDYSAIPLVMRSPQVTEAKTREASAKAAVSQLAGRYGSEHPRMVAAQGELVTAEDYLKRQYQIAVSGISREYEAANATIKALESALSSARGALQGVNRLSSEQQVLERDVSTNKQLYELFLGRAKETSTTSENMQTAAVARVVDKGIRGVKIAPKVGQIVMIASILGLFLGAVIAVLRENLDNTLKTTESAEQKLKQPLVTTLPLMSTKERTSAVRFYSDKRDSLFAEAIRTARTGILLSDLDADCKVIMITSSIPGEGKTTVSTNLAMALSQTQRALLIDADMRRPQIARSFELPPGSPGLSNLVAGTVSADKCMHLIEGTHLTVLPAGDIPPNPLELLISKSFKLVLEDLKTKFDVILLDSPPVELVSDALVLSAVVNSTVFVVKANSTPVPMAKRAITRLQRAGGRVLGIVLNQLDFKDASRYYGEQSAYGKYGYDSYGYKTDGYAGYGVKKEKPSKSKIKLAKPSEVVPESDTQPQSA